MGEIEGVKIEWGKIESVFVVDQVYEHINAPQWFDLSSPSLLPPDDVSWFCRPDCNHPTTADDFLNSTPPPSSSSKLFTSVSVSKLIGLVDSTRRDPTLKRRAAAAPAPPPPSHDIHVDSENEDPNYLTPNHRIKAAIKSSARKEDDDVSDYSDVSLSIADINKSRLKSTHSARDLFGNDLLHKFSQFCNDLKNKMSTHPPLEQQPPPQVPNKHQPTLQRLPFQDLTVKHKPTNNKKNKKNTINLAADAENIPVSLDINIIKDEKLVPIRTNPPTPQGFSATRDPLCKPTKSRLMDKENNGEEAGQKKEEVGERNKNASSSPVAGSGREGRTLDVFWFFKPCTLSS